jgi:hypothetical protein
MDGDSVEVGASGKGQRPRDHNRDWGARPHWPEVEAAQNDIREQDRSGRFDFFADHHNPSPHDPEVFVFAPPLEVTSKSAEANLRDFVGIAKVEMAGPLAFMGSVRRSDRRYVADWRPIANNWVAVNARSQALSLGMEIPWNTPRSTAEGYLQAGRELGVTIERYLRRLGAGPPREAAVVHE